MKVGDLVKEKYCHWRGVGIVTGLKEQRHWEAEALGSTLVWSQAPLVEFASVVFSPTLIIKLLSSDLEVISEG